MNFYEVKNFKNNNNDNNNWTEAMDMSVKGVVLDSFLFFKVCW